MRHSDTLGWHPTKETALLRTIWGFGTRAENLAAQTSRKPSSTIVWLRSKDILKRRLV